MKLLVILLKLAASILLAACFFVGVLRASPHFRTPGISRKIDAFVGALFFVGSLVGFYWLWF
jgi:hypothetical protein